MMLCFIVEIILFSPLFVFFVSKNNVYLFTLSTFIFLFIMGLTGVIGGYWHKRSSQKKGKTLEEYELGAITGSGLLICISLMLIIVFVFPTWPRNRLFFNLYVFLMMFVPLTGIFLCLFVPMKEALQQKNIHLRSVLMVFLGIIIFFLILVNVRK